MVVTIRSARCDNIRGILMFLVVAGHAMLFIPDLAGPFRVIYLFHMPAFVFLSGRFARYRPKRFFTRFIVPYLLFQPAYVWYFGAFGGLGADRGLTEPYQHMWYLIALCAWGLLLPAIDMNDVPKMRAVVSGGILIAVLAGFDGSIGRWLSLSRILVFFPYYAAGYYAGKADLRFPAGKRKAVLAAAASVAAVSAVLAWKLRAPAEMLFGAACYADSGVPGVAGAVLRLALYAAGAAGIAVLFLAVPDRPLPGISVLGRNTMPVYLLHYFIVLFLAACGLFRFSGPVDLILVLAASAVTCFVLGSGWHAAMARALRRRR